MEPTNALSGVCHFASTVAHSNPPDVLDLAVRQLDLLSDARVLDREGFRIRRRRNGLPLFNFSQVLWLFPSVGMDWNSRLSRQSHTLAANVLIRFLPRRGRYRVLSRTCLWNQSVRSEGLAWQFAKQVLVTLPREGSELEADFVREWLLLHLEILRRHQLGGRKAGGNGEGARDVPWGPWMRPGQLLD